jgi:hypothetical protein
MKASLLIRVLISAFICVLFVIAGVGWTWVSAHQTPAQARASHVVLGLSAAAGVIGLIGLWRKRPGH